MPTIWIENRIRDLTCRLCSYIIQLFNNFENYFLRQRRFLFQYIAAQMKHTDCPCWFPAKSKSDQILESNSMIVERFMGYMYSVEPLVMNCWTMIPLALSDGWNGSQNAYSFRLGHKFDATVHSPRPLYGPCPQHAIFDVLNPAPWCKYMFRKKKSSTTISKYMFSKPKLSHWPRIDLSVDM